MLGTSRYQFSAPVRRVQSSAIIAGIILIVAMILYAADLHSLREQQPSLTDRITALESQLERHQEEGHEHSH